MHNFHLDFRNILAQVRASEKIFGECRRDYMVQRVQLSPAPFFIYGAEISAILSPSILITGNAVILTAQRLKNAQNLHFPKAFKEIEVFTPLPATCAVKMTAFRFFTYPAPPVRALCEKARRSEPARWPKACRFSCRSRPFPKRANSSGACAARKSEIYASSRRRSRPCR